MGWGWVQGHKAGTTFGEVSPRSRRNGEVFCAPFVVLSRPSNPCPSVCIRGQENRADCTASGFAAKDTMVTETNVRHGFSRPFGTYALRNATPNVETLG